MSKSQETLADFIAYCEAHPYERFWQALRNWSGAKAILYFHFDWSYFERDCENLRAKDTFYWEGKNE